MDERFEPVVGAWLSRLGRLRDVVRQELVTRQLDRHLGPPPLRILDAGCGQGTQALRLARAGHDVTGVDASARLLAQFARDLDGEPEPVRERVRLINADIEAVRDHFPAGAFDVVLCHGVLMYVEDPAPVLRGLATMLAPGGVLSLLVRNGDALAMRPGLLGDWAMALDAFASRQYRNRLGLLARADRLGDLREALDLAGLRLLDWYGVRVFTDTAPNDAEPPAGDELRRLLDAEERAGRTDPYRGVAALLHLIAVRE